jgi:anti-anti-sigma regulatory factor
VSDHACWAYESGDERAALAASWLRDGLRIGQRCLYVGDGSADELLAELEVEPELADAFESGALQVAPAAAVYDLTTPIDAVAQLARYAAVVDEAMHDGYRGLRVAADISPLVEDEKRRPAHVRWEQIADRYIADHPFAPLCIYDARRVGAIDAIVCVHPMQGPVPGPFALYGHRASHVVLEGELDFASWNTLGEVLDAMPADDRVIDATGLSFIDGHSGVLLHDALTRRRADGHTISIVGAPKALRRVWECCEFDPTFLVADVN